MIIFLLVDSWFRDRLLAPRVSAANWVKAPGRSCKRLGRTARTVTDWRLSKDLSRETTVGGRDQQQELNSHDQLGRSRSLRLHARIESSEGGSWLTVDYWQIAMRKPPVNGPSVADGGAPTMTAPSGFVPDEQHRASRELFKQVGMRAGPVSEYFAVRNEGQPASKTSSGSGCARSDSQPAWIGRGASVGQLDRQSPSDHLAGVASFLPCLRLGFGAAVGECGEALSEAPTGVEARACPDRHPVARARSHLTTRRHVRAGVIATPALPTVDVVGERLVVPRASLIWSFVRSTYTFFSVASIRSTRPAATSPRGRRRIRCLHCREAHLPQAVQLRSAGGHRGAVTPSRPSHHRQRGDARPTEQAGRSTDRRSGDRHDR